MPTQTRESIGEVTVFDGSNAAELATLTGTDPVPEPDDDGAITLEVPQPPPLGPATLTLNPGDGLAHRDPGFMLYGAEALESYPVVTE